MRKVLILIGLILFGCHGAVIAQKRDLQQEELLSIPIYQLLDLQVLSPSRFKEAKSEAPASMIVVTAKQIAERGYFDLSDLLMDIPGIDFVDNARGYGEYYTIRGIEGNDRFLVLLDGVKINSPSGTFLSIGNSISISFAEQIEIIYGPASVVYGADAFAGIINIITKKSSEPFSLKARYGLGSHWSHDASVESSAQLGKDFSFLASARLFRSKGPDFTGSDSIYSIISRYHYPQRPVFEQPIKDHTVFLKAKYKHLTLSYYLQGFDEGNALGVHPNGFIYNQENHWKTSNHLLSLDYLKELSQKSVLSMQVNGVHTQIDPSTQWYKWFSLYQVDSSVSQYMTGLDNTIRFSVNHKYTPLQQLSLLTGLESKYTQGIPPYANEQVFKDSRQFQGEDAQQIREVLSLNEIQMAGLAQISYRPNDFVQFLLGGRYDYSTRYKGIFNPRSAFILTPSKQTQIKFLFGTAFQAPSLFLAYEQFADPWLVMYSTSDYQAIEPSWTLEPQRVATYEFFVSQEITKDLTVSANLYYNDLTNLIGRKVFSDSVYNPRYSTPGNPVYSSGLVNANFGEQTAKGVIIRILGRKKNLSYELSYSFTNASTRSDSGPIPISRVAPHKALLLATWLNPYFSVSTRLRLVGSINNENAEVFPDGLQPGYTQFDLYVHSKELANGIQCFGDFTNIFNQKIEHGGLQRQAFGYLPTIRQEGFQFRIGLLFQFSKSGEE